MLFSCLAGRDRVQYREMGQEAPGNKEQKAGDMGTWDMGKRDTGD